jgi:hypothetical protein
MAIFSGSATRVNGYTTQTLTFPAGLSPGHQSQTITVTNNLLCDGNGVITFRLQNVAGGQGTPSIIIGNRDHALTITDNDVCTNVSFAVGSATVSEGVGTYNVTVNITNPSGSQATGVDVALVSGDGARINGFTSQTISFPAGSSTPINVTLTVTNNSSCSDGTAVLTLSLENLTGGQGTPTVGAARTLTINDNDAVVGEVIARQAFDGLGGDNWSITSGAGNISTTSGASDFPANSRILSSTSSWQVNNSTSVLNLSTIDVSGYSNLAVTVRLSATTTNNANGLDVGDSLKVFVALNGAAFTAIPDIAVRGQSNARWTYASTQAATTTAGTLLNVQSPSGTANVNGPGTLTVNIPNGTQSIALRVRGKNNDGVEFFNVDDIQVTGDRCTTTYYSRASGNVGGAIWSDSPSGSAGTVTFDRFKTMHVQGHTVTVDANTRVNDVTVDVGGTLALSANTLTVTGDGMDINGTMTAADNSTLLFNSSDLTLLESTNPLDLFNLTANTPGDFLTDATIGIRGTLLLSAGEFDASTGAITLSSNANGTGRLGPVAATASYTGNITAQRYIPAGRTNWRLMGSVVSGATVNDWQDDFVTAGYPGSQVPGFSNPVGSGHLWPSVRTYYEPYAVAAIDSLWIGATSNTQSLATGLGFAAWCGTGLINTAAFTVDLTGAPHVALTPITVPLSYTNHGQPTIDGYNAASNPLPSPVLFSNIGLTNVNGVIYYYNPVVGNTAAYTIAGQVGQNGGTDTIQSGQAFVVKATGSGAQLQFEEADKVLDRQGGFFGGDQQSTFNGLRLKVSSGVNAFSDEAVVVFSTGTPALEDSDVPKMTFAHPEAPQIATMGADGDLVAINAYGAYNTAIEIPVMVNVAVSGTYTVEARNMENLGLTCLVLEDLETGTMTPLNEGTTYSFAIEADASSTEPRFMLHASAPLPLTSTNATCHGDVNGSAVVLNTTADAVDVTWTNAAGEVIMEQSVAAGESELNDLRAGEYSIRVSSTAGCGDLVSSFRIDEPSAMEATVETMATSCPASEDGRIDVTTLGGVAPYTFTWSNGSTDEDLVAAAGEYTVTIIDANNCALSVAEYTIFEGMGPLAMATLESNTVLVNEPVAFENMTEDLGTSTWDFGDGGFSEETSPTYSWNTPGTYTVTLTVNNGTCTDTWTAEVVVETNTGISTPSDATTLNAWYANDKFVVEHTFNNGQPVVIEVLDATGRLHITRKAAGVPARITIPADGLATGVWFLRLSNSGAQRTMRVPLVR